jgi:hypothetical protein
MNSQQSYKCSEKIIQEEVNKRLDLAVNKRLEYPTKELGDLLNEMAKNAQEKANLSEIKGLVAVIDLYCNKRGNDPMWCGYYIDADVYNKDKGIRCLSNTPYLPNRVKCTDYGKINFELYDSSQSASFVQNIRNEILDIFNILKPGILTDMGKQYIHIRAIISMDPNKPIKENPEISKYSDEFRYNNDRSNIKMTWNFYDPSKL